MGLRNYYYLLIIVLYFSATSPSIGQIVFKELPQYELKTSDSIFFDLSKTREIISLNGEWKVYPADDKEKKKFSVEIPSVFQGAGELVFEKRFSLTASQISDYRMHLFFLGLNYTADISINNIIIYRHSGGEFPFKVNLPRDILQIDRENVLSVDLFYKLDSKNTIPVKQRFMFPQNFGGIIKDVYLHLTPNISISDISTSNNFDPKIDKVNININSRIENREFKTTADSSVQPDHFELKIFLISPDKISSQNLPDYSFDLKRNKEINILQSITINSPYLWSPSNPQSYLLRAELWHGDYLLDAVNRNMALFSLTISKDSLILNGRNFIIEGTAYVPSFNGYGALGSYEQMEKDIRIIKETGFNSVRFSKSVPHPYYFTLCEKYGLFAFIELPINYIPADLAVDQNFINRSKNFLSGFLRAYKKYPAVAAVGLGSSYIPEIESHIDLLRKLADLAKKEFKGLTYASFLGYKISPVENLDLYGIEYFNKSILEETGQFEKIQNEIGKSKVIISEATYVVNRGNTDGYVTPHSYEAQAKYFEDLLEYLDKNQAAGYFINSMFDYRGDYTSLVSGYNKYNLYQIGICSEDRNLNRLSYKVIFAKLHNTEKVTIPIGSKKDDAPMIFIIFGLALALIMGVLVNSGRKFREDSTRALLRPYNFYADIRDQRIMSGYHSTVLALISAAISALLLSNLLYYFREDVVLERLLISFGSTKFISAISYLAWHPFLSLFWLTIVSLATLLLLTIVVKIASFFVRNKVYMSNVYFSVIWSFLPLVLLIPVGIILYRLLNANVANMYIYLGLLLFTLWVFYRLMKGIYVIFDVNPGSVYFYSIIIVLLTIGSILIYYEIANSAIDYLQLTIRNYNLLG